MSSSNNSELCAPGMTANNFSVNDWIFQGNTSLNPVYEGNFEADIDAIADSIGDDSGYFSNDVDSFGASNVGNAGYNTACPPSYLESKSSVHSGTFYADVPASNKSNHGSLDNGTPNRSTTHLEKDNSSSEQRNGRFMTKAICHPFYEYEHKTLHRDSTIEDSNAPRPLEQWASSFERHEWIAYRMEQPPSTQSSKKHDTDGRK